MKAVLALMLATLMGVNANNATNATTAAATQAAAVTTAAATSSNGTAGGDAAVTTAAASGAGAAEGAAAAAAAAGNATDTYTATVAVTATLMLPNGTSAADLIAGTSTVAAAMRTELAAGFKKASGVPDAAVVTVASIAAAARRALEERRELSGTSFVVTYSVVFPATAGASDVDAFNTKVTAATFGASLATEVAAKMGANADLVALCGADGAGCSVTVTSVAAPTYTKGGAEAKIADIQADASGTSSTTTPSSANAKFAGLTVVAAVLGMMAF